MKAERCSACPDDEQTRGFYDDSRATSRAEVEEERVKPPSRWPRAHLRPDFVSDKLEGALKPAKGPWRHGRRAPGAGKRTPRAEPHPDPRPHGVRPGETDGERGAPGLAGAGGRRRHVLTRQPASRCPRRSSRAGGWGSQVSPRKDSRPGCFPQQPAGPRGQQGIGHSETGLGHRGK